MCSTCQNWSRPISFYHATIDAGQRGRVLVDRTAQAEHWWAFTTKMTTSLAALGRPGEAEALYQETVAVTDNPGAHMQAARTEFDRALAADPELLTALVARVSVAHELGDDDAALADLDRAGSVRGQEKRSSLTAVWP